jgi:hypothetical protein
MENPDYKREVIKQTEIKQILSFDYAQRLATFEKPDIAKSSKINISEVEAESEAIIDFKVFNAVNTLQNSAKIVHNLLGISISNIPSTVQEIVKLTNLSTTEVYSGLNSLLSEEQILLINSTPINFKIVEKEVEELI